MTRRSYVGPATSDEGWVALSDESVALLERVRARSGIVSAEATVEWLIRWAAEHFARVDRENAKDRVEGPVADDPRQVAMVGGEP